MPQDNDTMNADATPGHVASTDQLGGAAPKRKGIRLACLLVHEHYKPGDQAPEGYLAWHEWAEVQHKAGLRQKQCGNCGLWRYPQELSEHTVRWKGFTARGKPVHQMAPLCLKCEARSKTPNARAETPTPAQKEQR